MSFWRLYLLRTVTISSTASLIRHDDISRVVFHTFGQLSGDELTVKLLDDDSDDICVSGMFVLVQVPLNTQIKTAGGCWFGLRITPSLTPNVSPLPVLHTQLQSSIRFSDQLICALFLHSGWVHRHRQRETWIQRGAGGSSDWVHIQILPPSAKTSSRVCWSETSAGVSVWTEPL